MVEILCRDEEQTRQFAKNLATIFKRGDVIVLSGELGAGKTKFVEGFLEHYGLEEEVSSPTFTIVNEYHNNRMDIYHFDLYRMNDIYEFENIGGEEYFEKGICIFEWGELIEDILPENYLKISFEKDEINDNIRKLILEPVGNRFNESDFTEFIPQEN